MLGSVFAAASLVAGTFASPLDSVKRASAGISAITDAQWAQLNQTTGGKLYKGAPWARPCFALATAGTNGNLDLAQCTTVQGELECSRAVLTRAAGWKNDSIIADNFGGMRPFRLALSSF